MPTSWCSYVYVNGPEGTLIRLPGSDATTYRFPYPSGQWESSHEIEAAERKLKPMSR